MSSKPSTNSRASAQPMLPYLDNGTLKYAIPPVSTTRENQLHADVASINSTSPLVSDTISQAAASSIAHESGELDDSIQRFTATGRPLPQFKSSGWANSGGDDSLIPNPPQNLPTKYTDDSLIRISVPIAAAPVAADAAKKKRSLMSKLRGSSSKGPTYKVICMPRSEYLKYLAKDDVGLYCGTEEWREWTAEELEENYGQYKIELPKTKVKLIH